MNIHKKTNTTLLLSGLAISMLTLSSGCRTGGFTKPDMSKLKFWKSENLMFSSKKSETPPPPARHFDPSPINGEKESEIVDLNGEKLQRRFKNDIEDMRAEISAAAKALDTPIRKPYSSDLATNKDEFAAEIKSSFDAAGRNVRSKLDGLGGQAQTGLSAAQNDFQAAMSNTKDSMSNEFAPIKNPPTDLNPRWKNKIELPGLAQEKNTIDDSLASVNKSLSDASNKLAAEARSKADDGFKSGIGAFGGSLKPMNMAATDTINQFSSNARQGISKVAQDVNSFAPTGATSVTNAIPELELVQAQMAEARQQIAELKKQVAMASQPNVFAPSAPQVATPNSFGPSIPSARSNSFGTTPDAQMPSTQSAPEERVAQLQVPGLDSRFTANSFSNSTPTNRLRSDQPIRAEAQKQASPLPVSAPSYPATSHGGYAPRSNDFSGNFSPTQNHAPPQNPIAAPGSQVDFQKAESGSMVVTANNAIPADAGDHASKIRNHVSEVDIPESVLKGAGSYAPGSVQPLLSDK